MMATMFAGWSQLACSHPRLVRGCTRDSAPHLSRGSCVPFALPTTTQQQKLAYVRRLGTVRSVCSVHDKLQRCNSSFDYRVL